EGEIFDFGHVASFGLNTHLNVRELLLQHLTPGPCGADVLIEADDEQRHVTPERQLMLPYTRSRGADKRKSVREAGMMIEPTLSWRTTPPSGVQLLWRRAVLRRVFCDAPVPIHPTCPSAKGGQLLAVEISLSRHHRPISTQVATPRAGEGAPNPCAL